MTTGNSISLYFSFLKYKRGIITVLPHRAAMKMKCFSIYKLGEQCLRHNKELVSISYYCCGGGHYNGGLPRRLWALGEIITESEKGGGMEREDSSEEVMLLAEC